MAQLIYTTTTGWSVEIRVFQSAIDGELCVQIDTPDDPRALVEDGQPRLRVFLNDADLYIGIETAGDEDK